MIPSASELDAWVAALETGHATTEMLPRFVGGYRRLLEVAEKAKKACETMRAADYASGTIGHARTRGLSESLDALGLPEPTEPPAQGNLFAASVDG